MAQTLVDGTEILGYFRTASNLVLHLLFWGLWLAGVFGRKLLDARGQACESSGGSR
jgi:hypothetical protein